MVVICNLHFDIGGKGQIEMEGLAENGSGPLDMVSRGSRVKKCPHDARPYGCVEATGYYNFRSYNQDYLLEGEGFF